MEERLFSWITEMRERNLRVTIQSACIQAKVFYKEINPDSSDEFQGSKGWFTRFSNRYNLTIRKKTTQTQRLPSDYIPKVQRFLLYAKDKLENNQYSQIIAYDETAVWYDSVGNTTIEKIGKEDVALASTGHDKQNITVGLAYCSDGTKLKPMVVFKGKGCTQEDKILKSRKDINVVYSDNGWFNADLINDWVNKTLKSTLFGERLLVREACCQVKGVNIEDISCLKQGRPCNDGLVSLKPL